MKYHFHISDDEFWRLSPTQLHALIERYKEEEDVKNRRTALVCAVIRNSYTDPKKKWFTVNDFMPTKKQTHKQTPEQQFVMLQMWQAAYGGKK